MLAVLRARVGNGRWRLRRCKRAFAPIVSRQEDELRVRRRDENLVAQLETAAQAERDGVEVR